MPETLSEGYRAQLRKLYKHYPDFGRSAHKYADLVAGFGMRDVLDYGCGQRTLEQALGFPIQNYDPAVPGCDKSPQKADLVFCGDVLEHIEPEYLENVLEHLAELTRQVAILEIATRPANKKLPDGRNAHLIVKPWHWWKALVSCYFNIDEQRLDGERSVLFICSPLLFPGE